MKERTAFTLSHSDIQQILDRISETLKNSQLSRKEILRISLLIEEGLLNFREYFSRQMV